MMMMIGYHHYQHSYDSSDLFLGNCVHELHHAEIKKLEIFDLKFLKYFYGFLSGALVLVKRTFWCSGIYSILLSSGSLCL